MGGYGSGRQSGLPTTSEAKWVDIRYIRKQGWLYPGARGSLAWTRGGRRDGNIDYRISGSTFTLDYRVCERDGDWEPVVLDIPLLTVPCRYGGQRHYFQCPNQNCRRRCEVLYSADKYFLCRKCCGYLYSSQVSDPLDRVRDAKDKVGKRIFEDYDGEWGWRKQKGMHQKTFDRGYARFRDLDKLWNRLFFERAKALGVS